MNAYFFPVSNEERENILNRHKEVYNGYKTLNPNPVANEQPLYIQDFANDKLGMVVNNKGEVKAYTNMGINESITDRDRIKEIMTSFDKKSDSNINEARKRKPYLDDDDATDVHPYGESDWKSPKNEDDMCEQCGEMEEDIDDGEVASSVEPAYQFQSHGPEDVYGTLDDYDSEHPHHDYNSMEDVAEYDPSDDLENMFPDLKDGMAYGSGPSDTFQHDSGDVDREGDEGLGQDTENDMDLGSSKPAYNFMSGGAEDGDDDSEFNVEEEVDDNLQESFKSQRKLTLEMFQRFNKYN